MAPIKNKEKKHQARVSESKRKLLKELVTLITKNNTVLVASVMNVSALQLQKLKHSLKNIAHMKVVKKNIALKAFEETKEEKKNIEELEKSIDKESNFALLFSSLDAFELAAILAENKKPSKVKPGQIAPEDIILEAGSTDLPAGPAISDLSKVKIKAGIEGGKIVVKERAILAKKGEKISEDVASVLAKLGITPITIGVEPIAAYDSKEKKVYFNIKINKASLLNELKLYAQQAFALALYLDYPTTETIKFLLGKANLHGNFVENLIKNTETKLQESPP